MELIYSDVFGCHCAKLKCSTLADEKIEPERKKLEVNCVRAKRVDMMQYKHM